MINYSKGRVEKADVALLRNVRTGIVQTTGDMTLAMAGELGVDTVEVSAHAGARNKGTGPMNHAEWQGKVYSISGRHEKYPPLIETTGYGTATGLSGINCRHSMYLYFKGVSAPEYTQAELDRINNTKVTYDGQQMDLYEATQKQRYIERHIRDWKRKAGALDAAGLDNNGEIAKAKEWQAKMRDFTKQTGLVRRYEWERVAVTGVKPKSIEITAESRSAAKELLTKRKSEEPGITNLVVESVTNKGGEMEGFDFRLKGEESLARKIATDSAKNKITIEHAAKDITDVNRYTGIFSKESLINNAQLVDKNIQASGFTLIKVKNTFGQPGAYQGLHYIYQHPDGRIFELQFHTPESIKIKNQAHKLYETSRVIEDKQLKKYLDQKMAEMWKDFEPPAGWSNIPDFP